MSFDANALLNNEPALSVPKVLPAIPHTQNLKTFNANDFLRNEPGVGDNADVDQQLAAYDKAQATYGTPGQQVLTAVEGVGQGLAGPGMTALEAGATKLGIPGLSPEEQAGRANANPLLRYGTEAATFGVSMLAGVGEARLASEIGNLATRGIEGATVASRIGATGIRTGAEIAALQTGSELSKMINQDPNQTIGSAAINVGLAGLLGTVAGSGLGAVSDLWKSSASKTADFLTDMKERVLYRQMLEAGEDVPSFKEAGVKETLGHKLGDYLFEKGQNLPGKIGEDVGEAAGAGLGSMIGHPLIGMRLGRKLIGPVVESIAKSALEGVTNPEAFKSAIDYVANAAKGSNLLDKAVDGVINSTEIIPEHLIPDQTSRNKLQEHLQTFSSPDQIINSGGQLGHYLPQHQTAAAALISQAQSTIASQKPTEQASSPWTGLNPVTPLQQAKFDRLLDLAQQPLMLLKHAQDGTLTNNDITSANAIYPGLTKAISAKLGEQLVLAKEKGTIVPYHVRVAASKLASVNLDASQSPGSMQAIMMSAAPQQYSNKTSAGRNLPRGHTTAAQLKAIDATNKLYSTRTQAREAAEAAGKA